MVLFTSILVFVSIFSNYKRIEMDFYSQTNLHVTESQDHRITGSQKPPQCLVPAAPTSLGHSQAHRSVQCCGFGQQLMEAMANQTPKPQPAAAQFKGPGSALVTAASSVRAPRRSEGPCGRPRQPPFRTAELSFQTGGPILPLPFHLGPGLFLPCFLLLSNC